MVPKKNVTSTDVLDVPIWDELVAELGDPRPYEPTVFTESYQPEDVPLVDPDYFDDLLYELTVEAEASTRAVNGWYELAGEGMDAIWMWPPHVIEQRNMTEVTTQFAAVMV